MSNPLEITVHGYAATNASLLRSEGRPDLAEFRIAATPRYRTVEGWKDLETEFITVKVWRESAQDVASSVRKGMPLVVIGRLATERWERAGSSQTSVVIHASSVSVEVRRGVVTYARVVERNAARPQEENPQDARRDDAAAPTAQLQPAGPAPAWDSETGSPAGEEPELQSGVANSASGAADVAELAGPEVAQAAAEGEMAARSAPEEDGTIEVEFTDAELEYQLQAV